MMKLRNALMLIIVLSGIFVVSGCSDKGQQESHATHTPSPEERVENYLKTTKPEIQEAYQFAVDHPEDLKWQPCYCGCERIHDSNLACFVKERSSTGKIIYDTHALNCGVCVDIALDVKRLKGEGWSAYEIRQYIDAAYSAYGPSTDTKMPPQ